MDSGIGSLDAGQLRVKINVSCIEGLCIYNLSAFCLNLCGKSIVNTGAVLISILPASIMQPNLYKYLFFIHLAFLL